MPNKNYIKGKAKENYVCAKLKKEGYDIAQRSAGSHSPVDVWAVDRVRKVITLIQCKPASISKNKKEEIEDEMRWLNNVFRVEFKVI